jgi:hypothetical protein
MAMSFKCSIFGHAYGDSEIERERDEEGNEVVTTIREIQTCKRCGETRVVSENKEVTTLETAADIVTEELDEDETKGSEPIPEQTSDTAEQQAPEADNATILDAETGAAAVPDETVESVSETPVQQETDPEADDGVILDEEQDESPRTWRVARRTGRGN